VQRKALGSIPKAIRRKEKKKKKRKKEARHNLSFRRLRQERIQASLGCIVSEHLSHKFF
jgi:hypothetical protein